MTEKIIIKGRELQYSSKQIAREVDAKVIDRLVECFIISESRFNGLNDILLFRSFLEKSLNYGSTKGESVLEVKK